MTVSELLPCPFCGEAGTVIESRMAAWSAPTYAAGCEPCNMVFCEDTKAQSIAAWNRRTPPAQAAEAVERVARALFGLAQNPATWGWWHDSVRDQYRATARAAIAAMQAGEETK